MNRTLVVGVIIALLALLAVGVVWAEKSGELTQAPSPRASKAIQDLAIDSAKLDWRPDQIVHGTVVSVAGEEFLISTDAELTVTLIISDTSVQWVPGQPPTRTAKLAAGDPILAIGRPVIREGIQKAIIARIIAVVSDQDLPKYLIRGQGGHHDTKDDRNRYRATRASYDHPAPHLVLAARPPWRLARHSSRRHCHRPGAT
jgi:hypothetical protein